MIFICLTYVQCEIEGLDIIWGCVLDIGCVLWNSPLPLKHLISLFDVNVTSKNKYSWSTSLGAIIC